MHFFLHQVQAAIRSSAGSKASLSEAVEASVIYVRFKAAASEVKFSFCWKKREEEEEEEENAEEIFWMYEWDCVVQFELSPI